MPFGLTNAPATFMTLMNDVMGPLLDKCVIVYLDDILIFSQNEQEHEKHLRQVLELLRQHKLYGKASKCEFFKESIEFLGHVISAEGIAVDPNKIQVIKEWPTPRHVKDIQAFLGLCNYYWRFVENYSKTATPLSDLTHKDKPFLWTEITQEAFETLKKHLINTPILCILDQEKPFVVATDVSDFAVGAVLCQDQGKGLQPVAYTSRKMNPAERRYATHEKELLAIIHALRVWRVYLEGRKFSIKSDHATLTHFKNQLTLTRRQARWMEIMEQYDYTIEHIPGKQNIVPDVLSRRWDLQANAIMAATLDPGIIEEIKEGIDQDHDFQKVKLALQGVPIEKPIPSTLLAHYSLDESGRLLYYDKSRICIPRGPLRTRLLYDHHDAAIAGHQGIERTYATLHPNVYWPRMNSDVRNYVKSCDSCQRIKAGHQVPAGLLQPLQIPTRPWEQISMDFITHLPKTKAGWDAIIVFVDLFSKMVHFVPSTTTATAPETARLFFDNVFRLHGLPEVIVSDRDAKFTSHFWKALFKTMGTKLAMSTAFHPQTDGQTERANRTLEDMLRAFVNYRAG